MILLVRLLPFLTGAAAFVGFEYLLRVPRHLFVIGPLVLGIVVAGVVLITRPLSRTTALVVVPPALLVMGALGFVLFPDQPLVRHLVTVGVAVLLWVYGEQLFAFQFRTESYQAFAIENISAYVNIVSVFLIASALFGFRFFLGLRAWVLMLGLTATLFVTALHTFAIGKVEFRRALASAGLLTLLGTEVAIALFILPADHYVNGLLIATFFYVTMNLTHYELRSTLDRARLQRYVLTGLFVVVLTLLTASWR
ncbi:MAG: hypothetical protein HYZ09_02365 [Candidatus Kerfeldbacteria bacterium]|nr:hypothetical protein [Candidatus Kerfeldbacteria bacterium]